MSTISRILKSIILVFLSLVGSLWMPLAYARAHGVHAESAARACAATPELLPPPLDANPAAPASPGSLLSSPELHHTSCSLPAPEQNPLPPSFLDQSRRTSLSRRRPSNPVPPRVHLHNCSLLGDVHDPDDLTDDPNRLACRSYGRRRHGFLWTPRDRPPPRYISLHEHAYDSTTPPTTSGNHPQAAELTGATISSTSDRLGRRHPPLKFDTTRASPSLFSSPLAFPRSYGASPPLKLNQEPP